MVKPFFVLVLVLFACCASYSKRDFLNELKNGDYIVVLEKDDGRYKIEWKRFEGLSFDQEKYRTKILWIEDKDLSALVMDGKGIIVGSSYYYNNGKLQEPIRVEYKINK